MPWTSAEVFESGAKADIENIAAVRALSRYSVRNIEVLRARQEKYSIPLRNGSTYQASRPNSNKYKTEYDPIAFNLSGLEPGGTTTTEIYLPLSLSRSNTYLRYNYRYNRFMHYVDKRGKPLYKYETLPNGRKKVTLTLVDGDKEWDGDGLKNGRIVDPGMIAEIIETENDTNEVGVSYSWQSSSDGISWEEIGTNETYEITENEIDKSIKIIVSYTDEEGFSRAFESEIITTLSEEYIPLPEPPEQELIPEPITTPDPINPIDPITGQAFNLDVDGDGSVTALGDGLMVIEIIWICLCRKTLTSKPIK